MNKILLIVAMLFAFMHAAFAVVNINTASKLELETVKGIGPVKAQAIIDYRQKNGQFVSVDDLTNVSGFGDKSVQNIRAEISTSGAAVGKQSEVKKSEKVVPK
ncbi:MAG: helix-hairpin-helix domain-containing protein [Gallionellaceae bacterium]|jgi:competence protein ComEA